MENQSSNQVSEKIPNRHVKDKNGTGWICDFCDTLNPDFDRSHYKCQKCFKIKGMKIKMMK